LTSNPDKIKQRARIKMEDLINKILPGLPDGMNYNLFIKQIILSYPVSEFMVKKYVENYYLNDGILILKDGFLMFSKKEDLN
jgi:hypothetical protein